VRSDFKEISEQYIATNEYLRTVSLNFKEVSEQYLKVASEYDDMCTKGVFYSQTSNQKYLM
jgi:hypothetical protein